MRNGILLAVALFTATVVLIVVGTVWPIPSARAYAGSETLAPSSSTPQAAIENLGREIQQQAWQKAYAGFANHDRFTESEFERDLMGAYPCLRTYAKVQDIEVRPLHTSATEADVELKLHWSTVVGEAVDDRTVHVVKDRDRWVPEWPIVKEAVVPPQVIPVNYLRWDVIYRGAGDDWGAQDVEAPHVRIVDMHPVERADGVMILGELLNEDVVPAYVSVSATLLSKNQSPIATSGSLDKISHELLPKQVTPFLISFPGVTLANVASVRMSPFSTLVPASADPVVEIDNQQLNPAPGASLTGELINQSGQVVNVAHVLGTFYDGSGNVVWVADQYIDRALLPQTPVAFNIHIPQDLAKEIRTQRTIVASFSSGGSL